MRISLLEKVATQSRKLIRLKGVSVARKKNASLEMQITFRTSREIYERLERCSNKLGLETSGLLRMICLEMLPDYEARADAVEAKRPKVRPQA